VSKRPRQADVARIAGVSQATVSVILGGNRAGVRLAEDTQRRVLEAAQTLGYVPDPVATRLASSRSNLLGVYTFTAVFPTVAADSYYPILVGIEQGAAELEQDLILFTGSSAGHRTRDHARIRRCRLADGCLFLGRHVPEEPIRELIDSGFPIVYIGRRGELGGSIPYVGADYVSASEEVVGRLAAAGHRSIRYVREDDDAPSSHDREHGVILGARSHGTDLHVARLGGGRLDVRRWRDEGATAIVVEETDTGAAFHAVTQAVAEAGLSTPRDVSLAVLGRPPVGIAGPVVSGFEVPRREMGRDAVRLLARLVNPDQRPVELHRLLPCPPVQGETITQKRGTV
jgi:DNA-binding LacI/PurR family transcriptional regulator